jgi:excisionase family DNA binding protein
MIGTNGHGRAVLPFGATRPEPAAPLIDCKGAAKFLAVSERTLFSLAKAGRVRCIRIGRRVLFRQCDLLDFINSNLSPEK